GKLTAARLEEDAEAILGVAAWGAEVQQWSRVLVFVKTVQASFALAEHVHQQRVLLELGRAAANRIGDRNSEIWCLQQLAHVADHVGDVAGAAEYRNAAAALIPEERGNSTGRIVLAIATLVLVAGVGALVGFLIGDTPGPTTT